MHERKPRMFGRNLLSRLLLATGLKREFEDVMEGHTYNVIKAINTAAADIVSTKMAESNFVTTHELSLVSDSIVRDVVANTGTKIALDDISDDISRAITKMNEITVTIDGISRTVDCIESTVDDIQHGVENIDGNESLLEEIQETLVEIKGLLSDSARGYGAERKLDTILAWMETIDQKIDNQHAELYNALSGGLRVVYDPSLAIVAKKERDQELLRDLVKAGIMEDANV
ncbi:MAG: hypothetical protein EBS00_02130 [Verrucomicrobia bacterium]|nr:hypothetical protein [Verrucomicrobiota bacterium]